MKKSLNGALFLKDNAKKIHFIEKMPFISF
jgi:hypothetical protein